MNELVYPREKTLGSIALVLGVVVWLLLIIGTFGVALLGLLAGFVIYLFAQSALIAHIKGNGVELSATQFPDLHAQFVECCQKLEIDNPPQAYILNGNGGLNAFATKFLGSQYVVLLSNVVDAMNQHPDGVRFYIGHELGHLRLKHISGHLFRWPVLWLPLLGGAYARAKETSCDRHGLACSASGEGAARALVALSAGAERWKQLDIRSYLKQSRHSTGFWMSFHELIAGYPWLTKRTARVVAPNAKLPSRNPFSYVLALFVPYAGRMGAGFGTLMVVYIIAILAAVAIPAYQDYTVKAKVAVAVQNSQNARDRLASQYESTHQVPQSLEQIGVSSQLADGSRLRLDPSNMVLTVSMARGELVFVPSADTQGHIQWDCRGGQGLKPTQLIAPCHAAGM